MYVVLLMNVDINLLSYFMLIFEAVLLLSFTNAGSSISMIILLHNKLIVATPSKLSNCYRRRQSQTDAIVTVSHSVPTSSSSVGTASDSRHGRGWLQSDPCVSY